MDVKVKMQSATQQCRQGSDVKRIVTKVRI